MMPERAILAAWLLWIFSWAIAATWSDPTAMRLKFSDEAHYRIMTLSGWLLLFVGLGRRYFHPRLPLWELDHEVEWALFAIVVLGFVFTWWARLYLGRLWSSSVTKKADRRIVDTGPYAFVRHPIYTGLIVASFATAATEGTPIAILGATLMTTGFYMKARLEEQFLREQLGGDAYDAYRRRVRMLVPFGPTSR